MRAWDARQRCACCSFCRCRDYICYSCYVCLFSPLEMFETYRSHCIDHRTSGKGASQAHCGRKIFQGIFHQKRWPETHHEAETLGPFWGSSGEVWVVSGRGSWLHGFLTAHVGAGPWEESHRCWLSPAPLAQFLSPPPSPALQQRSRADPPPLHPSSPRIALFPFQGEALPSRVSSFLFVCLFLCVCVLFCFWSNMFIWVCLLDPVEVLPQPLGILGEFGLNWALPKTNALKCETTSRPVPLSFY